MKKLLGGIFSRQLPPTSPPKDDGTVRVSPTSPLSAAAGGRLGGKAGGGIYKTGPRGSWSTFFAGNGTARSPPAASPPSAFPTSSKVECGLPWSIVDASASD